MTNIEIANEFLDWFSQNFDQLKFKYKKFCILQNLEFDDDIFSDTYLKIYDIILKNGMKDATPKGFDCYTFMSFKNNIKNEQRYSRNKKRDKNINSDNINDVYENWYNTNYTSAREKLVRDLFKDFSILYIMSIVEDNFDAEHFYLYRMKNLLPNMTYAKLKELTKDANCRNKVIEVSRFVKENVKKEDIKKVFYERYGNLIDE